MLKMVVSCLGLLLPAALIGQSGGEADEQSIRNVMDRFIDAWNRHDAKAWTAEFSEDADFTNVRGVGASGRADIEQFHARVFATVFKNSNQKYTDIKTRFIRPDVAAVDVHWEMTGATDPAGNPVPLRQGLLNFVMVKSHGKWQIAVMHNMDLPASPPAPK
ncbi:MAG: SgcJ/EcaC family oxidoreductase [Terracidiphilus sp.]|jgi:uncharacterized protein (TIGR02246 family)